VGGIKVPKTTEAGTQTDTESKPDTDSTESYSGHPDPGHQLQLVLLPWDTTIGKSVEFRCFVHKRRLCAVSQYDFSIATLLQVPERLRLFKRLIEDFYQQLKASIPYASCVMDVVVKRSNAPILTFETAEYDASSMFVEDNKDQWEGEEKERWRVHLLEFNPFYADGSSGTSLFDWKREFSIIYNGYKAVGDAAAEAQTVLRYRIHDPNRTYRGALDNPRDPRICDIV